MRNLDEKLRSNRTRVVFTCFVKEQLTLNLFTSIVRKTLFTFVPESSNNIIYVREHKLRRENCIAS